MAMPFKDTGNEDGGGSKDDTPAKDEHRGGVTDATSALGDAVHDKTDAGAKQNKAKDNRNGFRESTMLVFVILTTVGVFWQARLLDRSDAAMHTALYLGQSASADVDDLPSGLTGLELREGLRRHH